MRARRSNGKINRESSINILVIQQGVEQSVEKSEFDQYGDRESIHGVISTEKSGLLRFCLHDDRFMSHQEKATVV